MKKLNIVLIACIAALGFTSCVQDLNTEPINPNVLQKFDQDRIYYKIYAGLGTSGQVGPDGNGDLDGNEGYSVFYRCIFVHNEFPTDCGWWIWRDAGVTDLNEMTWTSENEFTELLYNRMTFNVTTCNHFLDNTEGKTDAKSVRQRAEVRFMRCLNYYYLLDFFGIPPFTMTVSANNPKQIIDLSNDKNNAEKKVQCRAALYRWVLNELLAAENYLDEETEVYRVNANAARLLLARLYLNANVYDPNFQYVTQANALDSAAIYAKKVMDNGKYKLTENYAQMFMGDNDRNEGACEVIFAIPQDGDYIQSWGATSYLVCMTRAAGMLPWGSTDKWECFRTSPEMVNVFLNGKNAGTIKADETQMPALLGDDRAILCNQAKAEPSDPDSITFSASFTGGAKYGEGTFQNCWAMCKWTGCYSTGETRGKHSQFVDTDVPLFRVAEAYMTYAEALWRKNPSDPTALQTINDLRAKRNAEPLAALDAEGNTLLDEWLREFYCEGRRRVDLIRFGQFCGPSATKTWEGHPVGKDAKYIVYPIPNKDIVANSNLAQNEGY